MVDNIGNPSEPRYGEYAAWPSGEPRLGRRNFLAGAMLGGMAGAGGVGIVTASQSNQSHRDPAAQQHDSPYLNVRSFGARGDGQTDDTAAIQKALDAAGRQGGNVVRLSVGHYLIRGSLQVPQCVTLEGVFRAPQGSANARESRRPIWRGLSQDGGGSVLLAVDGKGKPDGQPLISMHASSALDGLSIYYPEQNPSDIVQYPWTIRQIARDISVQNVLLVNSWQGVDCGTVMGHRHYIRNLYGQILKTGIFIDQCCDTGRVENVHFWPFWYGGETGRFMQREMTAFRICRTDSEEMLFCSVCPCHIGFHFTQTGPLEKDGHLTQHGPAYGNFIGLDAEGCGGIAVLVEHVRFPGLLLTNGNFDGPGESRCILIEPGNEGPVFLQNCSFWGGHRHIGTLRGKGAASFIGCTFAQWDTHRRGEPAFLLDGAPVTISNSLFNQSGEGLVVARITPRCPSAIISNNRISGKDFVVQHPARLPAKRFQIGMNVATEV